MRCLILGAGPAGLSAAVRLKQYGETSFLVLEKEQEAGGLCRSVEVDGAAFDIGGGHFLDVKRPKINKFLFEFMPKDEWNIYERNSQIKLRDVFVHHPLEANIWELPERLQREYLESISNAGCNRNDPMPNTFVEWIRWKLGDRITDDYMLPYNRKMFSDELEELGIYWLEKLPNVSYEETLQSCKQHKAYGTQPGHARFYYPKRAGYGELWCRMADSLQDKILYDTDIKTIDFEKGMVMSSDGRRFQADIIINTIPWREFNVLTGMPDKLIEDISNLKHSSIETRYFSDNLDTEAQWIYDPDETKPYHRILVRSNFCTGSRGYWTETRTERVGMFMEKENTGIRFINEYAYPLNTIGKQERIKDLLDWCEAHRVYGLGRWGEHQHYNSDVTVEKAIMLVDRLHDL